MDITPRPHPDFGDPPSRSEPEAWRSYWEQRQSALPLDFGRDRIEWQEVEFFEMFLAAGCRITVLHRRLGGKSNDFVWHDRDDIEIEVKTPLVSEVSYTSIARMIRKDAPAKTAFIIDLRDRALPEGLLKELGRYNSDPYSGRAVISRLFIFHHGIVVELPLT